MTSPQPPSPTSPSPSPATPTASRFARLWRLAVPAGLAIMAAALALGIFDTTAASAWIFVAGVVVGLVGVASLAVHLFDLGRGEVAALEKKLEDELDRRGGAGR